MRNKFQISNFKFQISKQFVNCQLSHIKCRKGFTLIEILIYMGLLGFVLLILTQILTSLLGVRLESQVTSSVQQDGNYILSRFYYDANRAESIDVPVSPGDQENMLSMTINGEPHIYSLSSGKLIVNNSLGTIELNSYDTTISGLSFQRLGNPNGNNTVTISFRLTSAGEREAGPESRDFQTTAGIR